jgi:predicted dehydrogenase
VKYANGVRGLLFTGFDSDIGCQNRLIGTEGVIELHNRQPHLRWKGPHGGWVGVETAEGLHGSAAIDRAIADVVSALDTGVASELCSENALRCTEVIFAVYESSRRRGRVDLPLDVDDSALLAMLDAGEIGPSRRVGSR